MDSNKRKLSNYNTPKTARKKPTRRIESPVGEIGTETLTVANNTFGTPTARRHPAKLACIPSDSELNNRRDINDQVNEERLIKKLQGKAQKHIKDVRNINGRIQDHDGTRYIFCDKNSRSNNFKQYSQYTWKMKRVDCDEFGFYCGLCEKIFKNYANGGGDKSAHFTNDHPELVEIWKKIQLRKEKKIRGLLSYELESVGTDVKLISTLQDLEKEKNVHLNERAELVARWCASNFRPFNIVTDYYLSVILAHAQVTEGFSIMPSYSMVSTKLKDLAERGKKNLSAHLCTDVDFFSLTADLWTSPSNKSFIGITIHFVDFSYRLNSKPLTTKYFPKRHTGVNIADAFLQTVEEFQLDWGKCMCVTTDSGANIVKALKLLREKRIEKQRVNPVMPHGKFSAEEVMCAPKFPRQSCAAHNYHLIVTTITTKVSTSSLLKKLKLLTSSKLDKDEIRKLAEVEAEKLTLESLGFEGNTLASVEHPEELLEFAKQRKVEEYTKLFETLAIQKGAESYLQTLERVREIIKKVRDLVSFYNKSSTAQAALFQMKSEKKPIKFKTEVITRWNSTLEMLRSYVHNEEAVKMLEKEQGITLLTGKAKSLDRNDLQFVSLFIYVLKPFELASKILSGGSYATFTTIPQINDIIRGILDGILKKEEYEVAHEDNRELIKAVILFLKHLLNKRFEDQVESSIMKTALLLDFRYYIFQDTFYLEETRERIDRLKKSKEELFDIWFQHAKLVIFPANNRLAGQALSTSVGESSKEENEEGQELVNTSLEFFNSEELKDLDKDIQMDTTIFWTKSKCRSIGGSTEQDGLLPQKTLEDYKKENLVAFEKEMEKINKAMKDFCSKVNKKKQIAYRYQLLFVDPLLFWRKLKEDEFPMLKVVAQAVFSIQATSVESERLFSAAGLLHAARRGRLASATTNDLLMARSHIKFLKSERVKASRLFKKNVKRETVLEKNFLGRIDAINEVKVLQRKININTSTSTNIRDVGENENEPEAEGNNINLT